MKRCTQSVVFILVLVMSTFQTLGLSASDYPDIQPIEISVKDDIVEGEEINITVYIKNTGESFSQDFHVALLIDDDLVAIEKIHGGVRKSISKKIVFKYVFTPGRHYIRVISDYYDEVYEKDEYNNEMIKLVYVEEIKPDIAIERVEGIPDLLKDGDRVRVNITLQNLGHEIDRDFYIALKLGEAEEERLISENISLGESYTLSINLTVRGFGYEKIQVIADSRDNIDESNGSNNVWEKEKFIYRFLPWYNESFHYRFLVTTKETGKARLRLNFSELLDKLDISATFDVNSIRVVEYNKAGEIKNTGVNFYLENVTNDSCNLVWQSKENGYYMVYFDVLENGEKSNVTLAFNESKNASIRDIFDPEGWRAHINYPENGSIFPENYSFATHLSSCAKIDSVVVDVFRDSIHVMNLTLYSDDLTNFSGNLSFDKEGNYTLRFLSSDKAGYTRENTVRVYVGKIDLRIDNITLEKKLYEGIASPLDIKVISNIPVENLSIRIEIELVYENISFSNVHNLTLNDSIGIFTISFTPRFVGDATLNVRLYPPNGIEDRNWSNNFVSRNITIFELPDLSIMDVFIPRSIDEGSPLVVHILVENSGDEEIEAKTSLYISKSTLNWDLDEIEDYREIKIPAGGAVNVSLVWKDTRYGSWIVGVEAKPKDIEDKNRSNNRRIEILDVKKGERNPPILIDFWCEPERDDIGYPIEIYAELSDDTGVEKVTLTMVYPDGKVKNFSMNNLNGVWMYEFISSLPGEYECYITAVDSSPAHNKLESDRIRFELNDDNTPPVIKGVWIQPREKQLINKTLEIGCIVSDNIGLKDVNITIIYPDGKLSKIEMTNEYGDRYILRESFDEVGQYSFFITSVDTKGNKRQSNLYNFWITKDMNDTDSDGIPDWWEEMYGLNPRDPEDAKGDIDRDGIIEIKEYAEGLNPTKPNTLWGLSQYEMAIIVIILIILLLIATLIISNRKI